MLKNLFLILVLLPATCFSQPEIGIKLGLVPGLYTGASLHASYNWKKKQVSVFTEAIGTFYYAEHIAGGVLINFKEREKKSRLYGGIGIGYAVGRYYPPGYPYPREDQTGLLLRSQLGFNFKMGRHMFLNIESGFHFVTATYSNYIVIPVTLGLSSTPGLVKFLNKIIALCSKTFSLSWCYFRPPASHNQK